MKKRKLEGTYVSSDESDSDQDVKVNKVPKVEKKMHRPPLNPIDWLFWNLFLSFFE